MIAIERMTPEGWQRVRAVRLRALLDAPDAFATMLAEDEEFSKVAGKSKSASRRAAKARGVNASWGISQPAPTSSMAWALAVWWSSTANG